MPLADVPTDIPPADAEAPSELSRAKRRHRCGCGCGQLVGPAPKRRKQPKEAPDALAFIRDRVRAYRDRMGNAADPVGADVIAGIVKLRQELDEILDLAVIDGRAHHDLSWTQVAELVGMTRRGAIGRWGERAPGTRPSGGQPADKR